MFNKSREKITRVNLLFDSLLGNKEQANCYIGSCLGMHSLTHHFLVFEKGVEYGTKHRQEDTYSI